MPLEREQIGACTLYRGDCYELLENLHAHAIVSDPPYGMRWDVDIRRFSGGKRGHKGRKGYSDSGRAPIIGDEEPVNLTFIHQFPEAIVWGYNHLVHQLGPGGVLVWLKRFDPAFGGFLSDAELAWVKGRQGVYCRRDLSMNAQTWERQHPAQKPVSLLAWCLTFIKGQTILDPFMGVGSTALACMQLGRSFVGVEIEEKYFQIACQRIEAAYAQPDLFVPTPALSHQQSFVYERRRA